MLNISKYCSIIDRCSSMYKNNSFKELEICSSHAPYFFFLIKNPGVTQEELSKRLVINKSNVTRSIQYLEEKDHWLYCAGYFQQVFWQYDRGGGELLGSTDRPVFYLPSIRR